MGRFRDRLVALDGLLVGASAGAAGQVAGPLAGAGAITVADASRGRVAGPATAGWSDPDRAALLRAQEELRRDIARHMHDGPAQGLANIALQAEIVQRLVSRGDPRSASELAELRTMVPAALETTKEFIFDVRPMVLDDLGLVPTLRRVVLDRGRRAGIDVGFDSQGSLRRIHPDLESGLFRIVSEATTGYLALRPSQLQVCLDWGDRELLTTIRAVWATAPAATSGLPRPDAPPGDDVPPALRAMIEQNISVDQQARTAARSLPAELIANITDRARALGVDIAVRDEGATIEVSALVA